ncbi:MAG: glycosyltransferase family 1 protein [Bacteroidetes bacterium]|nr:MAG: glycosyltransferase family 1 protein [Bacteroidota bacterium]
MSNLPRIVHLAMATDWRGGEQQLAYLLEESARLGEDALLICAKGSTLEAYAVNNDIAHEAWSFKRNLDFRFFYKLARFCKNQNIQLLAVHDSKGHTAAWLSARLFGNPSKIVVHRRVDFHVSASSGSKYLHRSVAGYICVSKAVQNMLEESLQGRKPSVLVYDGIDTNRFRHPVNGKLRKTFKLKESTKVVVNVAALTQQKDYFTFLDTAEIILSEFPNTRFIAFGEGHQEAELKAYAERLKISDQVIFAGFREDLPDMLAEADAFLFSSETEGLGTSMLDAMACSVPVVCTNAGGILEVAQHRVNAYVADVRDSAKLASGLRMILLEESEPELWMAAGRKTADAFSKEKMAIKTLESYGNFLELPSR